VKRPVVLAEDAGSDIEKATLWYAVHGGPELAARFLDVLDARLTQLEQFPHGHPEVQPGIRRILATPFPYLILYEIGEREVVVHRCLHGRRDPTRWRGPSGIS
jgi:plasmid stabilization system protein ParE